MTEREEQAVALRIRGYTYQEIADRLGVAIGTVCTLLHRTRARYGLTTTKVGRPRLGQEPDDAKMVGRIHEDDIRRVKVESLRRCRCGLLLPCNSCVPSAASVAVRRPD